MLRWVSRDGKRILAARALRSFAYGFLSVVLAIYLSLLGFEAAHVGLILTGTLVSSAAFTVFVSFWADRIGRRRVLLLFGALMALSGGLFALTQNPLLLILAALLGTLSPTGSEVGPFLSVEQAMIPHTCPQEKRTALFALYNMGGSFAAALGALFSGAPALLASRLGLDSLSAYQLLFGLYALVGLSVALLYLRLSPGAELAPDRRPPLKLRQFRSQRVIARLALLFSLDSFAGGFVIQSLVSYWFFTAFATPLERLALVFFGANLLAGLSFWAAAKLAERIGLVNTMVFTHLPANVLLMLVPLMPTAPLAILLYLLRASLSSMDIPTRQSYLVAIVPPEERTAAAGITNIARNLSHGLSPSLTGYLLQFLSGAAPFLIGGGLKILYDLSLYFSFRHLRPPEEAMKSHSLPDR